MGRDIALQCGTRDKVKFVLELHKLVVQAKVATYIGTYSLVKKKSIFTTGATTTPPPIMDQSFSTFQLHNYYAAQNALPVVVLLPMAAVQETPSGYQRAVQGPGRVQGTC